MEINHIQFIEDDWTLSDDFVKGFKDHPTVKFTKDINVSWQLRDVDISGKSAIFILFWKAKYGSFFNYETSAEFDLYFTDFEDEEKEIQTALNESYGFAQINCNTYF